MTPSVNRVFGVLLPLALALPALAQDVGDDWDLREDPAHKLTLATLEYEGAPVLAARCVDGEMALIVTRLNRVEAETRDLTLDVAGHPHSRDWRSLPGGTAMRLVSGMTMREVMAGGEIALTVGDGVPPRRYRLQAPANSAAIARVITACGHRLTYARDAERNAIRAEPPTPREDLPVWERRATPAYPERAQQRGVERGRVNVSCRVQADGRLYDCEAESDYPVDAGFGEEALKAANRSRVRMPADGALRAGTLVSYTVNFALAP